MSSWDDLRPEKASSYRPGLSDCQLRIMGSMEALHRMRKDCTASAIRAQYIEQWTEREPTKVWMQQFLALAAMTTIFATDQQGLYELTAWRNPYQARNYARRGSLAGWGVLGESGSSNVIAEKKRLYTNETNASTASS